MISPKKKPFFERATPCLKRHPGVFWTIFGLLCISTSLAASGCSKLEIFSQSCVPISLGILMVPWGIRLGYRITVEWGKSLNNFIESPDVQTDAWLANELNALFGSRKVLWLAVLFGCLGIIAFRLMSLSVDHCFCAIIAGTIAELGGFFAFMGLFSIFCLSKIVWRLGQFEVKVDSNPFGILSAGKTLLKCYIIGCVIWLFFSASTPIKNETDFLPVFLLAAPTMLFFVASFVICQIPLHSRMVDYKRRELKKVISILDTLMPSRSDEATPDIKQKIDFFELRKSKLESLPEWPFGWKSIIGLGASSLASVVPSICKVALEVFKHSSGIS